ncbi:MAG: UvrD-helicase domain-containing protein [Candidatus Omnitrophica bacterium]|nr:UvrD-helicase domain-containing protein [Candidatus Omnitrophota bacterium]
MPEKYVLKSAPGLSGGAFTIDYAKELNASQLEVVTQGDGPCLVLAGAGSGKTRTLIYRVAYLLERGVRPENILLVTFTNKAAGEMRNRVEMLLKAQSKGLWCGTFHHIGNRLLRMYGASIGLSNDFGILDEEDSRDLIKTCIKLVTAKFPEAKFPKPAVVGSYLSFASNAKKSIAEVLAKNAPYLLPFNQAFEKIKILYEEKKKKTKNLDYDDLLIYWIALLERAPQIREKLTRQFQYVLVDEYQDTNRLQHDIIRLLSGHHKNVLVVGDDAQSIYSFRAAEIKNILEFPETFPGAKIHKLETNYRSTRSVLTLANESIKHNVHQFPKTLRHVHGQGSKPQLVKVRDPRQEAQFIVQRIMEFEESGIELSEIAVLFRAHYQAASLELELVRRGISYLVRGGIRFFEQAHIKDALSYLKILNNPADEIAWSRALTLQSGIGAGYAERIFTLAGKEKNPLEAAMAPAFGDHLPARVRDGFFYFKKTMKNLLKEDLADHPDGLLEEVLEQGYQKHVLLNFENAQDRIEDLKQLVNFAHTYKNLKDFLADVTLRESFKGETILKSGGEDEKNELILSTIHQAKGLEWRAVFIIGLSEGQFPHFKSMEHEESLEEERRLFYVAATRAKEELVMTHPITRFDFNAGTVINRPSVFISELPSDTYVEVEVEEEPSAEETIYLDPEE